MRALNGVTRQRLKEKVPFLDRIHGRVDHHLHGIAFDKNARGIRLRTEVISIAPDERGKKDEELDFFQLTSL